MRVFPVTGTTTFQDTWGAPREGGRVHQGTDIFAPEGTPVRAVDDGRVRFTEGAKLGGNQATLTTKDGTRYTYSHLSAFEGEARAVKAGDVLGYVGHTGNAVHTPPHLHFEVRPGGGSPVNPFPELQALVQPEKPAPSAPSSSSRGGSWLWLALLYLASQR